MTFSKNFLKGTATAAHQVEGNNINSDCWLMENLKHSIFAEPSGDACDHYNRFEEDILLLKNAGLNTYRFSIEWARIEPKMNEFCMDEVEHYRKVVNFCHQNGITPIVTLHHFSSPIWLIERGGWRKKIAVQRFAKYCEFVAKELGSQIPYFVTINEANMGFQIKKIMSDPKPAQKKEGDIQVGTQLNFSKMLKGYFAMCKAFKCSIFSLGTFLMPRTKKQEKIIMQAHSLAVQRIKQASPNSKVGLSLSLFDYQVVGDCQKLSDKLWHEDFGMYLPCFQNDDFLGVQNYTRKLVGKKRLPVEQNARLTQMDYEDYPQAIGNVLLRVAKHFKNDLIVTENGIGTADDDRRCEFIESALQGVKNAIENGVKVKGYCYWSLLDNFEWNAGYSKTFGLVAVDRKTMQRYPKRSLTVLGELLNN